MSEPVIIAYLGKGGSGKSILSALTGKVACSMNKNVLLIDADPAMGLASALGIGTYKTIGKAREEIIRQAKIGSSNEEKERLSDIIDYLMLEALYEGDDFSMLVMGQTDTIGCFCPVNNLLRDTIESIASQFDVIIIDAEAGIEQISRQVVESVHFPIILSDNSMRGVKTGIMAHETIVNSPRMNPKKTGCIFNRVEAVNDALKQEIIKSGLNFYGNIPPDRLITQRDADGLSAMEMPGDSIALRQLKEILHEQGIL